MVFNDKNFLGSTKSGQFFFQNIGFYDEKKK